MIILHYTGMATGQAALERLCDPAAQASCHYMIWEDGRISQLVAEAQRAWHAGVSRWGEISDINSASIGIELVHVGWESGPPLFPDDQISACIALCKDILARHVIPAAHVLAHSDVSPGRKLDPGECFPWQRLNQSGVGLWLPPEPIQSGRFFSRGDEGQPIEALQAMLTVFGYGLEISGQFDAATETVVAAFQRHFRPERVDGVADASTIATLHKLLEHKRSCI